jgi:hypothetical protein
VRSVNPHGRTTEGFVAKGKHGRRFATRGLKVALIAVGALALLGGGTAYAAYRYDASTADRILPGVAVAGVDLSDMTRAEAVEAASSILPLDYSHVGILKSDAAMERVNDLLAETFEKQRAKTAAR